VHHNGAHGTTEGKAWELIISYLSLRFFTLLVLADDERMALQWGRAIVDDVREFVVSEGTLFYEVFDAGAITRG